MPKAILTAKYGAGQGIPIFLPSSTRGSLRAVSGLWNQVHAMLTFGRLKRGVES